MVSPFERTFDLDSIVSEVRVCEDTTCFGNFTDDRISNGTLLIGVQLGCSSPRTEEMEPYLVKSPGTLICDCVECAGVICPPYNFALTKQPPPRGKYVTPVLAGKYELRVVL